MRLPDFVIIGAAKSGTTSLYHYLDQHPEVFMSPRGEPSFFAHEGQRVDFNGPGDEEWNFVTDITTYQRLFANAPPESRVGEVSPRYLFFERSAGNMRHYIPEARLIAILRHPVDRAYSHFLMNRRRGCEPESDFLEAIVKEEERARLGWGWDWRYVSAGLYFEQLDRYYSAFPEEQIKVLFYEDLKENSCRLFGELFHFLGINESFRVDTQVRHRIASEPKVYTLQAALKKPNKFKSVAKHLIPSTVSRSLKHRIDSWNDRSPTPLPLEVRRELFERYFAQDCYHLESLVKRSLSAWRR